MLWLASLRVRAPVPYVVCSVRAFHVRVTPYVRRGGRIAAYFGPRTTRAIGSCVPAQYSLCLFRTPIGVLTR